MVSWCRARWILAVGGLLTVSSAGCDRARDNAARSPNNPQTPTNDGFSAVASAAPPKKTEVVRVAKLELDQIRLPPGFHIAAYATGVDDARSLTLSPNYTLYVGTRESGKVYAIPNADKDASGDRVIEIAHGLDMPNGVAFHDGSLYVAEVSRVLRYDDIDSHLDNPPKPIVVSDRFPKDEHHGWKYIAFGPDQKLYVPIGAPCNVCDEDQRGFATITRMQADGGGFEVIAHGVRNTVGFDWHPVTHQLWFTDNGRDRMGDDVPPDELDRLSKVGENFGFPYCHGNVADPEFGKERACAQFVAPERELSAHVAALGMKFYTGTMFPREYRNQIFIAEHGSWNRTHKAGYRLMLVRVEGDRAISYEEFATGWLRDEVVKGRPVDVLVMPDGALLVSDDEADAIYRIYYAP